MLNRLKRVPVLFCLALACLLPAISARFAVTVPQVARLTVTDALAPSATASDPSDTDLCISETAQANATIKLHVDLAPGPAPAGTPAQVLWELNDGSAGPPHGNFGAGDPAVLLTPAATREFKVKVGADGNGDGALQPGEVTHKMTVWLVKLISLITEDNAHPTNQAANPGGIDHFVADYPDRPTQIRITALFKPHSRPVSKYLRWRVDGVGARPTQGDFSAGPAVVTLNTAVNRAFRTTVGSDRDGDGRLLGDGEALDADRLHIDSGPAAIARKTLPHSLRADLTGRGETQLQQQFDSAPAPDGRSQDRPADGFAGTGADRSRDDPAEEMRHASDEILGLQSKLREAQKAERAEEAQKLRQQLDEAEAVERAILQRREVQGTGTLWPEEPPVPHD
ncbi:MAG: hypothetical protein A3K19_12745 [Lentisphaerae bacterium RIFOXYB12_FULL_65_16]|nr:MAG: hypothetical protein A3K18_24305 [Lentisphaerae bacterium RIFOXYA12_64_32]OGV88092.1 MAG: hypothetical protein A3K19_12745 [Lentisphaerae bacterium RIFOXYB12_FULL_65_16]